MKILITGSSGFIGSSLKEFLEKQGHEIVSYDIRSNPKEDVRDFNYLLSKFKDVEGVIHLAAISRVKIAQEDPLKCVRTNIGGTINVLETAKYYELNKKHPWVIFGSSREVFGESPVLPVTEDSPRNAINIYGVSKITGEDMCKIYSTYYGLKTRVLRFSNVYTGLNDQLDRVIPKFILHALTDKNLIINGTGEEQFDFTYIEDTIQGIYACIQHIIKDTSSYEHFNISSGEPVSLKDLAKIIIKKTGSNSEILFSKSRTYDVSKFYTNPIKAKKYLGFRVKISLDKGIELAIKKLKNR